MIYTIGCEHGRKSTVDECLRYFKDKPEIQIDTETTGRDPHVDRIVSLQIGDSENQWFIDCSKVDIMLFKDLIEGKLCLLQNAKFDYKMLKKVGIMLDKVYDTMLAECVLYCGYDKWGYGLDKLSKRYLDIEISKEERATFIAHPYGKVFTLSQIAYGATDVMYLQKIRDKQMHLIEAHDLKYCLDLENEVMKALGDIEYNGMILDKASWNKVTELNKVKQIQLKKELDEIVLNEPKLKAWKPQGIQGDLFGAPVRELNINYGSTKQVKEIFEGLGYKVDSTDDRQLSKFVKRDGDGKVTWSEHVFFEKLQDLRGISKIISTYGDGFLDYINSTTGKIHTDLWQILSTGRISSNTPNLQNLPADNLFRNCFKARKGHKWVSIDYSGQELRLMADGSGEQGFIEVLNRGEDLHCYAGSMMFKKPITKKDKDLRNKAKTINFGKPYGMGPPKLADTLGITVQEADELFKEYAIAFPTLNKWLDELGKSAVRNEYSLTFAPCKRRRWYPMVKTAKALRKQAKKGDKATWKEILTIEGQTQRNGGNSPIQGSGADICKEALVGVRNLIETYRRQYGDVAYLVCTVHDAIDVEVREDLAEQFSKEMAIIMIEAGNKYVSKVKMEVDITITDQWQK